MQLMEVIYLNSRMNRQFASRQRDIFIARAVNATKKKSPVCPFNDGSGCAVFEFRPMRCRLFDTHNQPLNHPAIHDLVSELSRTVFLALSGRFLPPDTLCFSVADTISGKFVQAYFHHMRALERAKVSSG
jgi:Fe-S-cluster containining protein